MLVTNPALRAIIEKAVKPVLQTRQPDVVGKILAYYPETNTIDVEYEWAGVAIQRGGIPLLRPHGMGLIARDPWPGDEVWISFYNDDVSHPYAVMVVDQDEKKYGGFGLKEKAKAPYYLGDLF